MMQMRVGLLGLLEVVRRQEDRRAALAADLSQVLPQRRGGSAGRGPAVGSSRNSTFGWWIRLRTISSLRRIPPENVLIGLKSSSLDAQERRPARATCSR